MTAAAHFTLTRGNDQMKLRPELHQKRYEKRVQPELLTRRTLFAREFERLKPSENAVNTNRRGIAYASLVNGNLHWTDCNTFQLGTDLNAEEGGRRRTFTRISDAFLHDPVINALILAHFDAWQFEHDSYWRDYEVTLQLIGYVATRSHSAMPAPTEPHQDGKDGSITLLYLAGEKEGGVTRVFSLSGELLTEDDLQEGESLFMIDSETKHVVSPISVPLGSMSGVAHRLLMTLRFRARE